MCADGPRRVGRNAGKNRWGEQHPLDAGSFDPSAQGKELGQAAVLNLLHLTGALLAANDDGAVGRKEVAETFHNLAGLEDLHRHDGVHPHRHAITQAQELSGVNLALSLAAAGGFGGRVQRNAGVPLARVKFVIVPQFAAPKLVGFVFMSEIRREGFAGPPRRRGDSLLAGVRLPTG